MKYPVAFTAEDAFALVRHLINVYLQLRRRRTDFKIRDNMGMRYMSEGMSYEPRYKFIRNSFFFRKAVLRSYYVRA